MLGFRTAILGQDNKFLFVDNSLGGFMHGRFQGKNVHDARNNAMLGQRERGYNVLERGMSGGAAHGFASRTQRFNENRRPGAD